MKLQPLTAATTQLVVSRIADADLDQLGVCSGDDRFRDRRRIVVDAIRRSADPIDEFRETQFLARTTVEGREVVLLCIAFEGSQRGDMDQTAIIRRVFPADRAAELIALGKGLAPFAKEVGGRHVAGKSLKDESNANRTEVATAG